MVRKRTAFNFSIDYNSSTDYLKRSGRCCWSMVVLLCCLATSSSGQRQRDFYSSVSTLSDLIHLEKEVKANLLSYLEHLKFVQDSILKWVSPPSVKIR